MNAHVDLGPLMGAVALHLLGEPSDKSKAVLRWGSRGSLSVSIPKGTFYDHETGTGGGVLDLIERETGKTGTDRMVWLADNKFIDPLPPLPSGDGNKSRILKTYDYRDEANVLLFQVCRREPKDFRQRKPDPARPGEWLWKVEGVRQVPYLLPELIEDIRLGKTVFIVEGEKDVDRLRGLGVPATTNAGGANKWRAELTKAFVGADVVIVPDNDQAGRDHAQDVATKLAGVASKVRVLELPGLPLKGDVSDWLNGGGTADALYDLADSLTAWSPAAKRREPVSENSGPREFAPLEDAAPAHSEPSPTPLTKPVAPSAPYPVEALGNVLAAAAKAIAAKVQCPIELAAQSVLSVASLAAQAHADVVLPMGQTRPLSLFCATLAESSDRKTTSDREAMVPVKMYEQKLASQYKITKEIFDRDYAAWSAQYVQITRGNLELAVRKAQLEALGPAPPAPIQPIVTMSESTVEGLIKTMPSLPGSLGLFSTEGAQLLQGHGFTDDTKRRSAATFSLFWDGEPIRRGRASAADIIHIKDRRVALHVMIQPDGARTFLSDPVLRDQGLPSRILLAAPATMAGSREWKPPSAGLDVAMRTYTARLLSLFEVLPASADKINELVLRPLPLSPAALEVWVPFYNGIERDMGPGRRFAGMKDVAGKAGEQACRIAGVLAIVEGGVDVASINAHVMARACELMHFHLSEAERLAEQYCVSQEVADAEKILTWCRDRGHRQISATTMLQSGPGATRCKERLDPAIEILLETGSFKPIEKSSGRVRNWHVV
jgi:Protein of unknown function (DUF3987)